MADRPACVTCIDIKSFFKVKIDCVNTKSLCLVFSTSNAMWLCFFALIMVKSCKSYFSSFSDVLGMCIASETGELRAGDLQSVFAIHTD